MGIARRGNKIFISNKPLPEGSYKILIFRNSNLSRIFMRQRFITGCHRGNREASCSTCFSSPSASPFWARRCFTHLPATGCERQTMTLDYALGAIVTVGLLFYLAWALIRPERF
jgi:K+-transporting ATPase KdpF subunit